MILKRLILLSFLFWGFPCFSQDIGLQNAIKELYQQTDTIQKISTMGRISYMYQYQDSYKSVLYADSALQMAKKINYKAGIAKSYNFLGLAYAAIGKLDLALKNYLNALKANKDAGIEKETAKNLNNIADVLITIGNIKSAKKYVVEAYNINVKYKNLNSAAISLSLMSDIYLAQKDYTKALYYLEKARNLKKDDTEIFDAGFYNVKMGKIHLLSGNLQKAQKEFNLTLGFKNAEPDQLINAYTGLAAIKSESRQFKESKALLMKALKIAKKTSAEIQLLYVYEYLSKISSQMNDLNAVVNYLSKKDSLRNELMGFNTSGSINSSLNKIITDQKDKENEELRLQSKYDQNELRQQKKTNIILFGGISIAAFLVLIAFINYRNKNKAYKKLDEANQLILKQNANLEQLVEKRTLIITQKNAKLKEVAYFNSHRVRKHMANILGLIHVASFETNKDEFFGLIESEAKSLDETLSQINSMTKD
ncbi:tetratricopeptide repeat protein [Pedobacter sp. SD-b]|uniref:Tetratricopeptide repeat protein n=1 Tax=Pedobacter segetis TaxID=2793069 RepID=A0ABS1BHH5_9SPHI|nr:tetratricopeptide repeat protein [Pedobacter segetis]MBK0382221.1 tetratricopeptide repeat protein [Pedobacter segetis]